MKLSDDLKKWRADRPDEWTMDRFIEKAKALENTWISVDDRLPEEYQTVLVWCDFTKGYEICRWNAIRQRFDVQGGGSMPKNSPWMPLPASPDTEEEKPK